MPFALLLLCPLCLFAGLICQQDLKHRLVSLWLLLAYMLSCLALAWAMDGIRNLLVNAAYSLAYFALLFGGLVLFYFMKEKKMVNPVNTKIGLADLLLLPAIGLTFGLMQLVLFFSVAFFLSALLGLTWFRPKGQTVPLAGLLCVFHVVFYFCFKLMELIS